METIYLFLDSEHEAGGGAIKFASRDKEEVITFIGNYVLDSANEGTTAYFELIELPVRALNT